MIPTSTTTSDNLAPTRPQVALYQPQIPQNTGNIGRLCVGFDTTLHLVGELGFSLSDKYLKRAGLDYWQYLIYRLHSTFEIFFQETKRRGQKIYCFTKRGETNISDQMFEPSSVLLFGQEQHGFPKELLDRHSIKTVYIKQLGPIRSHNLANSVAMGLYKAYFDNKMV